ncbi:MAG: dockerin type I repeat-containing protein, partial [Desulfobacteraceae bacterium]|nr:dockerin type I repeat-containing protein [Desulfobacteraceae bacterium]
KLYIYPGSDNESQPSVPANASRSFYFNITMLGYGQQTIESKVVPMYNDTLMAIANVTTTVKGYGNVTVNTIDANDSSIAANVVIGSTAGTTVKELEGSYSLNATKAGYIPVNTTVSIVPGSNRTYTAKLVDNASDPAAVFYETNTTALPANVSGVVTKVYNFTVQSNGGKTIIALQTPANHTFLSAAVNGVNASARNESGIVYVEAELTGDSVFEVRFKAPRMFGDVNDDNTINAIDVAKIKRMIVGLDALDPIADFNEDGAVNAIDVAKMKRYIVGLP